MKRHPWWTASALALVLGMWLVTVSDMQSAAADDDAKAAILKLAAGTGDAEAIAKKFGLDEVMPLFKPRAKKGLGVGDKAGAIIPDGIELKLIRLAKRTDKADVAKNAAAYEKMAQITVAIAKVADAHTPKEKRPGMDPKEWKKFIEEMKAGATDLAAAAKAGDAAKVKTAANKTNGACNDCHSIFRD